MKKILFLIFTFFFGTSSSAFEYITKIDSIHTVILQKDFSHCIGLYISTKVGHLQNGICNYEKETDKTQNNILFCTSGMSIPLSGQSLKQLVGPGYQCAASRVSDLYADPYSKTYALDEFVLISDNAGNYIGSQPASGEANIRIEIR